LTAALCAYAAQCSFNAQRLDEMTMPTKSDLLPGVEAKEYMVRLFSNKVTLVDFHVRLTHFSIWR